MARAIWSGVISFGLVSVPVELYSATRPHEPTFHRFEKGTGRVRTRRLGRDRRALTATRGTHQAEW